MYPLSIACRKAMIVQNGDDEEGYELANSVDHRRVTGKQIIFSIESLCSGKCSQVRVAKPALDIFALIVSPQTGQALVSSSIGGSFQGKIITQSCVGGAGTGFTYSGSTTSRSSTISAGSMSASALSSGFAPIALSTLLV